MKRRRATARKHALRADLMVLMPRDAQRLHQFARKVMGLDILRQAIIFGHDAPFDSLPYLFFEGQDSADFKPGSFPDCLGAVFEDSWLRSMRVGEPTRRWLALHNGSAVERLARSHTPVPGTRVHTWRCDEAEEFDPDVWAAAQMVTGSGDAGHGGSGAVSKLCPRCTDPMD